MAESEVRAETRRPTTLALLSAALVLLLACARSERPAGEREGEEHGRASGGERGPGEAGEIRLGEEALRAIGLEVAPVSRREVNEAIRTTAVVKPNEDRLAHVRPPIPGRAIEVRAVLGQPVEPGEVLAELDSLELGERKAAFLEARANLEVARRSYQRERRLFERQISSEKEYLEARGEFERRQAAYRQAREALRLVGLAEQDIARIGWGDRDPLSRFSLRAPIAGTVIARHLAPGELVGPQDEPFTVADLTTVWVIVDVHEGDLARVRVGDRARVSVDSDPGEVFEGRLAYLGHVVDPATRTAPARIEIPNPDGRLRPGMFARVEVTASAGERRAALAVPRDAVQTVRGRSVVFVAGERPGVFVPREVSLGARGGDLVEVRSGLREGERVVTRGAFSLKSALLEEEIGEGGG